MSYLSDLLGDAYKEGMTEDEISSALEARDTGRDDEITKLKQSVSKANSEAAAYKKQLRAKQSEEEAQASTIKEQLDKLTEENEGLRKSIALTDNKSKLIAMGYDEKLALDTAQAIVDGDMTKVLANQVKFNEAQKQNIIAEHMRNMEHPAGGSVNGTNTYEKELADARAVNDMAAMVHYTRLANTPVGNE